MKNANKQVFACSEELRKDTFLGWSSINAIITDRQQCSKESLLFLFRNLLQITHNHEIAFFVRSLGIAFALDGMPVVFRIVSSQTSQ